MNNQPSPVAAAPSATAPGAKGVAVIPSLEERVAAVNEAMDADSVKRGVIDAPEPKAAAAKEKKPKADAAPAAEAKPEPDVEVTPQGLVGMVDTNADPAPDPEVEAAKKRADERRARLAAATEKNRERVDRKAALAAQDRLQREAAAAIARAEAAEAAAAKSVDLTTLDEAGFFALAEQKGIAPDKLHAWLLKAIQSPEKAAEAAALSATQRAFTPKLTEHEKQIAAVREEMAALKAQLHDERANAEEQRATHSFLNMVSQSAERAPLAHRLLTTDHREFMEMAEIAASRVPGQGPEALLDAVEELLDGDGRQHAQKMAALYGLGPAPASASATPEPSQTTAPTTPTTRGAAKPKTVSNSLAQGRTTLVDEQDFASLSLEERAAILKRS